MLKVKFLSSQVRSNNSLGNENPLLYLPPFPLYNVQKNSCKRCRLFTTHSTDAFCPKTFFHTHPQITQWFVVGAVLVYLAYASWVFAGMLTKPAC